MAWTKIKIAAVATVGIVLAAGTTELIVSKTSATPQKDDPSYWELNSRTLNSLPPMLIIRPTKLPEKGGMVSTSKGRCLGINTTIENVMMAAYDIRSTRIILPPGLPDTRYDYLCTVDSGRKALQDELERNFHLKAHTENRETDVLLLKVKSANAPGLHPSNSHAGGMSSKQGEIQWHGMPFRSIAQNLEWYFGVPIFDSTGTNQQYDMTLRWKGSDREGIKQALIDQLGLELVAARMPVQMLIVEKTQ